MNSQNNYDRKINTFLGILRFTVEYLGTIEAKNYLSCTESYTVGTLWCVFLEKHFSKKYKLIYLHTTHMSTSTCNLIKYHNKLNKSNIYIL